MLDITIPTVGAPAPSFCLQNSVRTDIRLEDYQGKWLILYLYPKDNTPGCTTEALEFTALKDEFTALDCEIIGLSPDSPTAHQNFIAKHNLGITLLSDPEHQILDQFGAWQLKKNYGKEYMGVVRSTFLIDPTGIVRHVWPNVKAAGHAANVLATLRSLR